MKKTAALISLAHHIQNKYAELGDGPPAYSNPEDTWIDDLRTRLSQLGRLYNSVSLTRMGRDKTFHNELIEAINQLTKVYYRAIDISRLGPNYRDKS